MARDQIKVIIGALDAFSGRTVKRLALNVTANLIEDTPVDTGWARANWIPSIGVDPDFTAGTREEITTGPQEAGRASLNAYKPGPEIYISNNVYYVVDLNEGTSSQAPAAFVQAAIQRAIQQTVGQ